MGQKRGAYSFSPEKPENVVLCTKQENCLSRPSFVMESVPFQIYLRLASIFGMDPQKQFREDDSNRCKIADLCDDDKEVEEFIHLVETELGMRSGASMDEQVEVGTLRQSVADNFECFTVMQFAIKNEQSLQFDQSGCSIQRSGFRKPVPQIPEKDQIHGGEVREKRPPLSPI